MTTSIIALLAEYASANQERQAQTRLEIGALPSWTCAICAHRGAVFWRELGGTRVYLCATHKDAPVVTNVTSQ
jgi:hypothetical protein